MLDVIRRIAVEYVELPIIHRFFTREVMQERRYNDLP